MELGTSNDFVVTSSSADKENLDNLPDFVRDLRAKDDLERTLEAERRRRRAERAEAFAERQTLQERAQQDKVELQQRLQLREAEHERQREEQQNQLARLTEQLEAARVREAALLEQNESLTADMRRSLNIAEIESSETLALRARVDALSAELVEVHAVLKSSDEVREALLKEAKDRNRALEQARAEIRELHLVERSGREQSQAQYERLNAQCEALARQAQERSREADVLEERNKRLEEQLRLKTLEAEKSLQDADVRRHDEEAKATRATEETATLRDELRSRGAVDTKLRGTINALEVQIQDHKAEDQRLRKELLRLQSLADERDMLVQSGKRREQGLTETIAALEERLSATVKDSEAHQTECFTQRRQSQALELDVKSVQEALATHKAEAERVRSLEGEEKEAVKNRFEERIQELTTRYEERLRDAEKRAEEKLAQRDADLAELRSQLDHRLEKISRHEEEIVTVKTDLSASQTVKQGLEAALQRARDELTAAATKSAEAATAAEQHENTIRRLTTVSQRTASVADKNEQTSPRLMPSMGPLPEGERWGNEIAALHRSMESLQARLGYSSASTANPNPVVSSSSDVEESPPISPQGQGMMPAPGQGADTDCARTAVRMYSERRIDWLERRMLLWDAWQLWSTVMRTADMRARVELAVGDELRLAMECRAREEGLGDVLTDRYPDTSAVALKRYVLEFRHRLAAALAEVPASEPGVEMHVVLARVLDQGRRGFGRVLHASMFLYQKLRTLVPTELRDSMQDPLCGLVPVPFYVLPYKAQHALKRGAAAIVHRRSTRPGAKAALSMQPPEDGQTREAWMEAHLEELEKTLPLVGSSPLEVPTFLARLLRVRSAYCQIPPKPKSAQETEAVVSLADAEDAPLRDRLDVLLVDALTVYMSAWRISPASQKDSSSPHTAARAASRRQASAPCHRLGGPPKMLTEPKPQLRLGQRPIPA